MDDENPFMIGEIRQDDEAPAYDFGADEAEAVAEADTSAEGLVPLCVRHQKGPHQADSAVFGYDIALLEDRPWTKPGANVSDYFNYGFNETSWRAYCAMQCEGNASLKDKADQFMARLLSRSGADQQQYGSSGGYGGQSSTYAPQQPQPQRDHLYKTRMCTLFLEGRCTRGDDCKFAHGQHEVRQYSAPPAAAYQRQAPPPPPPPMQSDAGLLQAPVGGLMPPPPPPPPAPQMGGPQLGGFRMAPKRARSPTGDVYEPRY